ncbi:MAG: Flp family type IVb pilin [Hyphomicrobiaceae bacterium]
MSIGSTEAWDVESLAMTVVEGWRRKDGALARFARDRRGATSVEYGLIAVLVAVGMLAGLKALGAGNSSSWSSTSNKITDAMKERSP